jgi:hypothetical protein
MTREEAQIARVRRRARIGRIRQTVAVLSLTLFIAMFSTIYVQMAAGRDPVLSTQAAAKSAAKSVSTDTSSSAASSDSGTATDQPAAVTTSQS